MGAIIRLIKNKVQKEHIKPVQVVKLSSGVTTYIYANGVVDVKI